MNLHLRISTLLLRKLCFSLRTDGLARLLNKAKPAVLRISKESCKGSRERKSGWSQAYGLGKVGWSEGKCSFWKFKGWGASTARESSGSGIQGGEWLDLYMEMEFITGDKETDGLGMYPECL